MEQRLQEVLLDGEIVRWSGRPSPFKLMSIPSRTSLLLTWVLCSAALAVILAGLVVGLVIVLAGLPGESNPSNPS